MKRSRPSLGNSGRQQRQIPVLILLPPSLFPPRSFAPCSPFFRCASISCFHVGGIVRHTFQIFSLQSLQYLHSLYSLYSVNAVYTLSRVYTVLQVLLAHLWVDFDQRWSSNNNKSHPQVYTWLVVVDDDEFLRVVIRCRSNISSTWAVVCSLILITSFALPRLSLSMFRLLYTLILLIEKWLWA